MAERERRRIGLVYGGRSAEHEVSLRSAESVFNAANKEKLQIIPILVTRSGAWFKMPALRESFTKDPVINEADRLLLSPDPAHRGFIRILPSKGVEMFPIDVVFPIIHGTFGEDGTLQGLLDMSDIPYVGCGTLASAMGMDKVAMKSAFIQAGLEVGPFTWFLKSRWIDSRDKILEEISKRNFPVFVKPANLGSSVGIRKAKGMEDLSIAVDLAAEYDRKILVEEEIKGREIEISVLGNEDPIASVAGEIVSHSEFYDYEEKYLKDTAELHIPAQMEPGVLEKAQKIAITAYKAIDGSGLARADMFVTDDSGVIINELNTMPGFTSISMYPKLWEESGVGYSELIDRLIDLALERSRQRKEIRTDRDTL